MIVDVLDYGETDHESWKQKRRGCPFPTSTALESRIRSLTAYLPSGNTAIGNTSRDASNLGSNDCIRSRRCNELATSGF